MDGERCGCGNSSVNVQFDINLPHLLPQHKCQSVIIYGVSILNSDSLIFASR